jgi:uncharacterized protein (TIGR02118 family)
MIKTVSFLRARPGMTREEFARHWLEVHGPLSLGVPGIRRYVQNHIVQDRPARHDIPAIEAQVDGVVEMWYDNWDDYELSRSSTQVKALHADGALFIGGIKGFVVEEKTIIER